MTREGFLRNIMGESTANVDATTQPVQQEPFVQQVVEAVAEAEGVDPVELEPLCKVIDTDALESLFRPQLTVGAVPDPESVARFEYCGYEVTVSAVGTVSLTEA